MVPPLFQQCIRSTEYTLTDALDAYELAPRWLIRMSPLMMRLRNTMLPTAAPLVEMADDGIDPLEKAEAGRTPPKVASETLENADIGMDPEVNADAGSWPPSVASETLSSADCGIDALEKAADRSLPLRAMTTLESVRSLMTDKFDVVTFEFRPAMDVYMDENVIGGGIVVYVRFTPNLFWREDKNGNRKTRIAVMNN